MRLQGKVAIVSGGGQGIGEGIVHCLAEEGADVAVFDMNLETASSVSAQVESEGRRSLALGVDVTNSDQIDDAVARTVDALGGVDILVNNVGGGVRVKRKPREERTGLHSVDMEEEEWDKSFELNAKTQFLMCRAVIPRFLEKGGGKIVNIGSRMARNLDPQMFVYTVTKAAVVHFTKQAAVELAPHNINVNCVCPGDVMTPNIERAFQMGIDSNPNATAKTPGEAFLQVAGPRMAFNRIQTPEDMGRAVAFLVSEDAKNITGQALYVDGGQTFI